MLKRDAVVANAVEIYLPRKAFEGLNQILLPVLSRLLYFPPLYHLSTYLACTIACTCRKSPWQTCLPHSVLRGAVFPKFRVWTLQNCIFPKPR